MATEAALETHGQFSSMMNVAAGRGWRLHMDCIHCRYEQISLRPNEKKLVGNKPQETQLSLWIEKLS